MANENKEIGDIVKKCKFLLLDIEGTTTSISFVKDKLFPYAKENVKQFLEAQWASDDVKEVVAALRKLALEDQEKSVEGHVAIPGEDASKEDQIEALVNNVKWQMASDRKTGPLKQLQGMIWKQGYDKGDIKGHVYDDVSPALEQWQSVDEQKVYIYSSGSVQAQKLLFGQSQAGDLLKYIEGHFDTAVGAKQESASYSAIVEKIGTKADDVLFLTDIVEEAAAARTAGLHAVLVSREGNAPLPSEATENYTVIHSLGQLTSNKRKTDPQEEQPTKVPKTDISNDVKTTVEPEITKPKTLAEKKQIEPEKMEVEEDPILMKQTTDEPIKCNENKKPNEQIPLVVDEDITDVKDSVIPIPIVDAKTPVLTDNKEPKADKQEIEKMETEVIEKVQETKVDIAENIGGSEKETEKQKPEQSEPEKPVEGNVVGAKNIETTETPAVLKKKVEINEVKEESPIVKEPIINETIITKIEDVTDKENLTEMVEVKDLEPVVEEPNENEDIELQNVADVLEKECDEILSKVQNVTNLDNIPLKSTLNPIAEETMETENLDSNDIMERILDQETELESQQSENGPKTVMDVVDDAEIDKEVEITDKKVGNTDKVVENVDKVVENTDKVVEHIDKVVENTDKVVENTDKVVENTGKVVGNTDKVVGNTDKVVENTDKVVENKDKVVENKDKVVENTDKIIEDRNKQLEEKPAIVEEKTKNVEEKSDKEDTSATKVHSASEVKEIESKMEIEIPPEEPVKESIKKPETNDKDQTKVEQSIESLKGQKTEENTQADTKENDKATEEQKPKKSATEDSQVNGDATNGEKESVNQNGDSDKEKELSSRLSVENGKEVNGSNGDSMDTENGTDKKVEVDVADIKIKTVTTEEPHSELIEQPTEA